VTAIAYKDGVLASDSLEIAGGVAVGNVKKIAKRDDGCLAAASGDGAVCQEFLRLFCEHKDEDWRPDIDKEMGFGAVVISPAGRIFRVTEKGRYEVEAEFYTEGIEYQILTGAMAAGASAVEAVQIAIRWGTRCGGPVQTVRLTGYRSQLRGGPVPNSYCEAMARDDQDCDR
jgi:hypothetical protein